MKNFWLNKKVLITGHTGFKGSWLSLLLKSKGAKLYGISRNKNLKQKLNLYKLAKLNQFIKSYKSDIQDFKKLSNVFKKVQPDICFHLAAQAQIKDCYDNPLETFKSNTLGVANILESVRLSNSLKAIVLISSDAVYKNLDTYYPYAEINRLGGKDPYSASKSAAELLTASYSKSYLDNKVSISTVRAGNVIGGGDWSSHRIINDAIYAWRKKKTLIVRNPHHIRPWQHVLDPLHGYLKIAENQYLKKNFCKTYNFGPEVFETASVRNLIIESKKYFHGSSKIKFLSAGKNKKKDSFALDFQLNEANSDLKFEPKWNFKVTIKKTIEWYNNFYLGKDARDLFEKDINDYINY